MYILNKQGIPIGKNTITRRYFSDRLLLIVTVNLKTFGNVQTALCSCLIILLQQQLIGDERHLTAIIRMYVTV